VFLLDTNILVYAVTKQNPRKREQALALIRRGVADGSCCITAQVIRELAAVLVKFPNLSMECILNIIAELRKLPQAEEPVNLVELGIELHHQYGLQFYDAMILAVARIKGCDIVYSEDMSNGQVYDVVRVVNPFL